MKKTTTKYMSYICALGVVGAGFFGVTNAQAIIDWWRLRDYKPPTEISKIADEITLTDYAKRLFYVHKPDLQDKEAFQQSCNIDEVTIVLGCYVASQKIFLYDVEDERLAGLEQVTAAHEVLHAAYDRLSTSEKNELSQLLDEAFERLDNPRIQKNVQSYQSRDASVVASELHSILGTEVGQLSKELEEYYQKYFTDRSKVVTYAENYAAEFEKRESEIATFDQKLEEIGGEIARLQADLKTQSEVLTRDKATIEALIDNTSAYNAKIPGFNAKINTYNADINRLKSLITEYNAIVEKRNQIAVEERNLQNAIDTRAQPL